MTDQKRPVRDQNGPIGPRIRITVQGATLALVLAQAAGILIYGGRWTAMIEAHLQTLDQRLERELGDRYSGADARRDLNLRDQQIQNNGTQITMLHDDITEMARDIAAIKVSVARMVGIETKQRP